MNIEINQSYSCLEKFIREIPFRFEKEGTTLYSGRNQIKRFEVDGISLNVKRFRKPHLINRIAYSFFRKPKAFKAYHNAQKVISRGFETPMPIGYLIEQQQGLVAYSYFVSLQQPSEGEIREYWFSKGEGDDHNFLESFASFSAQLHEASILHLDYSPGNILYVKESGGYRFSLVDINRMQFRHVSLEEGALNFCRLFEYDEAVEIVAARYAQERGFDIALFTDRMLYHKRKFLIKDKRKDLRIAKRKAKEAQQKRQ